MTRLAEYTANEFIGMAAIPDIYFCDGFPAEGCPATSEIDQSVNSVQMRWVSRVSRVNKTVTTKLDDVPQLCSRKDKSSDQLADLKTWILRDFKLKLITPECSVLETENRDEQEFLGRARGAD